MNTKKVPFILIIYGPTGVGKTDFAFDIAKKIPIEIINMDVGQFYTPVSIGTAKPDWKNSDVPHHLFDIFDSPRDYSVIDYRKAVKKLIDEIVSRGNLPVLVGGSGFYLRSLLFPPRVAQSQENNGVPDAITEKIELLTEDAWQELNTVDPERAAAIGKTDLYRIKRALDIWYMTGQLPSSFVPMYDPIADYQVIFVERERQQHNEFIKHRVDQMFKQGWLKEAQQLMDTPWEKFIERKKLIGYTEIFNFLRGKHHDDREKKEMIEIIENRTRHYAKRQRTFWRKIEREIVMHAGAHNRYEVFNVTDEKESKKQKEMLLQRLKNE